MPMMGTGKCSSDISAGAGLAFNGSFALDAAWRRVGTGASSVDGGVQGVHCQPCRGSLA